MSQSATEVLSELETSSGSLRCWDHAPIASGHLAIVPESRTLIPHDQPLALAALITEFLEAVPAP